MRGKNNNNNKNSTLLPLTHISKHNSTNVNLIILVFSPAGFHLFVSQLYFVVTFWEEHLYTTQIPQVRKTEEKQRLCPTSTHSEREIVRVNLAKLTKSLPINLL